MWLNNMLLHTFLLNTVKLVLSILYRIPTDVNKEL